MNEVKDFHPLVEQWLLDNGYTFQHHVRLEHGIIDYIAKRNGNTLVIECKSDGSSSNAKNGRFFAQVLDYARQVPNSKPCAALPIYLVTEKTREICEYYGIELIVIDTLPKQPHDKGKVSGDNIHSANLSISDMVVNRFMYTQNIIHNPQGALDEITQFHKLSSTSPVLDIMLLWAYTQNAHSGIYGQQSIDNAELFYFHTLIEMRDNGYVGASEALDIMIRNDLSLAFLGLMGIDTNRVKNTRPVPLFFTPCQLLDLLLAHRENGELWFVGETIDREHNALFCWNDYTEGYAFYICYDNLDDVDDDLVYSLCEKFYSQHRDDWGIDPQIVIVTNSATPEEIDGFNSVDIDIYEISVYRANSTCQLNGLPVSRCVIPKWVLSLYGDNKNNG